MSTHWTLKRPIRVLLAVTAIALVLVAVRVDTARAESCSSYTPNNRECTAMEQYGYCLTNAMDSYYDCADGAGFFGKAGCLIAYEVDYYACAGGLAGSVIGWAK